MNSGLSSHKYILQMMSSMLCMADPSDLVGPKNSENVLILAESGTHVSFLGLELSLSMHISSR